jgi:hypothetical protein
MSITYYELIEPIKNKTKIMYVDNTYAGDVTSLSDNITNLSLHNNLLNYKTLSLPKYLTKLIISSEFNFPLNNLPVTLEYLHINCISFTYDLDNLPLGLNELHLENYSGLLENLPSELKILDTGNKFNNSIDNLPLNLERLILGLEFNQRLDKLPGVQYIKIIEERQKLRRKDITVNRSLNSFNQKITYPGLKVLVMVKCINFDQPIDNLPPMLQELKILGIFNQPIDNLPFSLNDLQIMSETFNHPIDKLPSRIKNLYIDSKQFNHSINNLPNNINKFYIRSTVFNQHIMQLPKKLEYLKFECPSFNMYIKTTKLPKKLKDFCIVKNDDLYHNLEKLNLKCNLIKNGCC